MNVSKMLAELRQERECLSDVIRRLERLASFRSTGLRRRGRPPGTKNKEKSTPPAACADSV